MLRVFGCFVAGILSLAYLGASGLALRDDVREVPILALAAKIEGSQSLPTASSRLRERLSLFLSEARDCRERARKARVTSALFLMQVDAVEKPELPAWQKRLSETRDIVHAGLRCNPLDGNLWIIAADLERMTDFDRHRFRTFVDRSIDLAPFEGSVLDRRWSLLTPLAKTLGVETDGKLRADMASVFAYSSPQNVVRLVAELTRSDHHILAEDLLADLSEDRRDRIQRAEAALLRAKPKPLPAR